MKKRFIPLLILVAYIAILIKVMVFKDISTIRIGHLLFNFGGTESSHSANFVPFKTILSYLFGKKGRVIAIFELVGNIALLVPMGFIIPFVASQKMTWQKALAFSIIAGLGIETLQAVFRVGIFDIDDVILNALGVMIGYWAFTIFIQRARSRSGKIVKD